MGWPSRLLAGDHGRHEHPGHQRRLDAAARAWANGVQDVTALAGLFNVSEEAMSKRLTFLGFLDDETRPLRTYFRREAYTLAA